MEVRRTWKAATDLWLEAYSRQMAGHLERPSLVTKVKGTR
jgi:hypothetical protein